MSSHRGRRVGAGGRGDAVADGRVMESFEAPPALIGQAAQTRVGVTAPPLDDHRFGDSQGPLDLIVPLPLGSQQDNACP